jgi:hypothetical protein
MAEQNVPPSSKVEVGIDLGDPQYVSVAEWVHGDLSGPWWRELGDLLGGRPGWRCDLTSEGLLWSFGASGSSLFNISFPPVEHDAADAIPAGYDLYDWEADETVSFSNTRELLAWLEANEPRHAGHLRKLRELAMTNDWAVLKSLGWKARVSYDGGTWVGTVEGIPADATFSTSLAGLTDALRELIAASFEAPADVAPDISLSLKLDHAATAALTA